jgi:hypothetical protein
MVVAKASGFILPAGESNTSYWDSASGYVVRHALQSAPGSTTRATLFYQGALAVKTYSRDIQRGSNGQVDVWDLSQIFRHGVADALQQVLPAGVDSGLVRAIHGYGNSYSRRCRSDAK